MKFEKINEDKIRITLTSKDLRERCVDFHDLMASPIESQSLFLDMLDEAEEKVGFKAKDYNLRIEAISMSDESFIFVITRMDDRNTDFSRTRKKFTVRRKKTNETSSLSSIYCFNSFDDYCNFLEALHTNLKSLNSAAKSAILYTYKNSYYLVLSKINLNNPNRLTLYSYLIEFANHIEYADVFISKLNESGKVVIKNNALKFNLGKIKK
jgi:adapter protein MecA 1/2